MIEAGREMFGAPAIALVETDDIEAARPRLGGQSAHVMSFARALEAVQRDQRRVRLSLRMPMAVREDSRVRGDIEESFDRGRQVGKRAPTGPRVDGHLVAAGPAWQWNVVGDHLPLDFISRQSSVVG